MMKTHILTLLFTLAGLAGMAQEAGGLTVGRLRLPSIPEGAKAAVPIKFNELGFHTMKIWTLEGDFRVDTLYRDGRLISSKLMSAQEYSDYIQEHGPVDSPKVTPRSLTSWSCAVLHLDGICPGYPEPKRKEE